MTIYISYIIDRAISVPHIKLTRYRNTLVRKLTLLIYP